MKLVIFDLDNTLIDIGDLVYEVFNACIKHLNGRGLNYQAYQALSFWKSKSEEEFETKLKSLGVSNFDTFFKVFDQKHFELLKKKVSDGSIRLMPGSLELLNWLKDRSKLAIATNTQHEIVNFELDAFNLREFFDCIVTPQHVTKTKPYPDQINFILSKLNVKKEDALLVGDSNSDILAGKAAGIKTAFLAIKGKTTQTGPDYVIKSLLEVKQCLENWI
jgi:HAD superfamily hydrolase (TIGR01509 family)